jgi:hypothetical protein
VSHLAAEVNVEQVFSWSGQLSEVNLDPDTLADMVPIMDNTHHLLKTSWTSTMRCSVGGLRSWVLSEEESVVCVRETSLSFIKITQSLIY